MTSQEKLNLVTNYFSEDWAIEKAMSLLEDYDKAQQPTQPLAPTDDEIDAVVQACRERGLRELDVFRAVLAKWGALCAEKIVIPTDTMEQEFQKHYQRGYAAGQKASATQPTQAHATAVPMSHKDAKALVLKYGNDPLHLVLQVERHHGIKGGQQGAE